MVFALNLSNPAGIRLITSIYEYSKYIPTQIVIFQELIKSVDLCKLTFYVSHMFQCFLEFFESPSHKEDLHRKCDFTARKNISWHEMMACQLIFVQPIRGLI